MMTIISFILVLGFLIFIHEMGHFLAARHVGVRVETFSIGFPPRAISKKYGETEYVLSWLPLGGYVRLFGQNMNDEDPQDPTNYASKSIAQRFYILVAGPAMNLLFAFLFMPLVYMSGISIPKYLLDPPVIATIQQKSFAEMVGMKEGDEIIAINRNPVRSWEELQMQLNSVEGSTITLEVERDGYVTSVTGTVEELKEHGAGWSPRIAPVVGGFSEISAIRDAGLQIGDRLLRIDTHEVNQWGDISKIIRQTQSPFHTEADAAYSGEGQASAGIPIDIEVERRGEIRVVSVTPDFNEDTQSYLLGMTVEQVKQSYGLVDSVMMGTERLIFITIMTFQFLGEIIAGQGSIDDLGGPLRIGIVIGEAVRMGLANVFFLMAVISLQLGIFNLLPIPVLDGGHIFFLVIEKLKGGPLSPRTRERTQMIGFALLMFFMIAVTYNDFLHLR